MEKTIQSCENCKHRFDLVQFRYYGNGCEHIKENGFICDIFAYDGPMVYDRFYCPSCDHCMEEDDVEDYYPNCGQKICWDEE